MSTYKGSTKTIKEQAAVCGINAFHFLYTCWILCAQKKHHDGPHHGTLKCNGLFS